MSLPLPLAAFVAGMVSFVTPCVLPLVPGYISLISGTKAEELGGPDARVTRPVLLQAGLFVLGFTVIFMALGAIASGIGQLVARHFHLLSKLAGAVIVLFGLHTTGLLPLRLLYRDTRVHTLPRSGAAGRSFVIGAAFGFGWTPCVGPILATILTFAASSASLQRGTALLALYSFGLGIPFLLTSLGVERFLVFYRSFRPHLHAIEVASGVVMIVVGVLIFTRHFALLNAWFDHVPLLHALAKRFL
jgi:cytochrome c-type biogenesis protein